MSFPELKRLNVISEFENRVDYLMANDCHDLSFTLHGYLVFIFKATETLNSKEREYITKHFGDRKTYHCGFLELEELASPHPGLKFSPHYKRAHDAVVNSTEHVKGVKYFVVIRSGL